ncbi:tail fiber domain-containing protein [Myxococcus sp. K15C18031901]|uniref:tail fiber domain-containing protein n=1 Tax=Myxococcus dinghuensis TaxID=2906761 RepID=UPI0020A7F7EE|nr:tail fiber domain-containing protein [Myxococcus dinghuensis]MCP3098823.1 tail fiber domain-containing protein [Myxococcus dinghuensis]
MRVRPLFVTLGCLSVGMVGCGEEKSSEPKWEVGSGLRLDDDNVVSVAYGAGPGTVVEGSDARLSDARSPLPGSPSYIHNGTQTQEATLSVTGAATSKAGLFVDATSAVATPGPLLRVTNTSAASPVWDSLPLFSVDAAGGLLARGEAGFGKIPMTGAGVRMMWFPKQGAFRAGVADTEWDEAHIGVDSWAGGSRSMASGYASLAFGDACQATGVGAVCFGATNSASGSVSFASGANSVASGFASLAQGYTTSATGQGSVALGYRVAADGDYCTALGTRVSSGGWKGSFIWGDVSTTTPATNTADNQFLVRAAGGIQLRTNSTLTTGCNLPAGSGVFSCTSDRHQKEDFLPVDGERLLDEVARLPVETWRYKEEAAGVRHLGPVAQDFRAAFGLGTDDKSIGMLDIDGVNMAAIQALERRTRELRAMSAEVRALREELRELKRDLARSRSSLP